MGKLLARLYSIYAILIFALSFLLFFPIILICIWVPGWNKYGRKINRYWARGYFIFIFLRVEIQKTKKFEKNKPYIFLANHFSYLDIAMMGLIPGDVLFVGKASIQKAPLFGYYFKNLHIAVDRDRLKSRAESMKQTEKALESGSSVIIFPEGGISSKNPPEMIPFKNGPFRMAKDKQIPIIPVTLSYNHLILPDDGNLLFHWRSAKMVLHEPLISENFESEKALKDKCFEVIQNQLDRDN
ncbi:1-acyl-sn-glycerol-3-phosphate acyltransferase [Algoriphagus ratkowskyi]|uniref:1-acyl-sn-glycerol-3-phosphate acyltransferase n=1 Tax=Algoriphagus ratkowskyi TaxID=57028 RepID=A0A2W7R485_9BACT|nr:lysophospholipid acyltransferase family protein [Algoriphagus ratkowskyi]PZX50667.1 1-acyl-sn-glycerol-3-phosphate acyltransferase [Algoriphagus ratkowskyi]TXD80021.1 1-acyl-sn-glycerol-3-phosphate acyltransferase [Algoriphagus ratkowskyi]